MSAKAKVQVKYTNTRGSHKFTFFGDFFDDPTKNLTLSDRQIMYIFTMCQEGMFSDLMEDTCATKLAEKKFGRAETTLTRFFKSRKPRKVTPKKKLTKPASTSSSEEEPETTTETETMTETMTEPSTPEVEDSDSDSSASSAISPMKKKDYKDWADSVKLVGRSKMTKAQLQAAYEAAH